MNNRVEKSLGIIMTLLLIKNIIFIIPFIKPFRAIINIIVILLVLFLFLCSFSNIIKRNNVSVFTTIFITIIYSLFQLLLFPKNVGFFIDDLLIIILYGIVPFLLAISINNYDYMLQMLKKCSYVIVVLACFSILILFFMGNLNADYSMSFGSSVVVGVAILEYFSLTEKKILDIALFFLGMICIILGGSRGPLLSIIVLFVLNIFIVKNSYSVKRIIYNLSISLIGIFCYIYYDRFFNFLYYLFLKFGVRSRTLLLFMNGRLFQNSGRDYIYELSHKLINENCILGIGYDGLQGLGYLDLTPHNTFLELLLYNGIFMGGVLIILLSILWITGILKNRGTSINHLCIIFFSLYVPRSFIGAGGIKKIDFWILLAFSLISIKYLKVAQKVNEKETILNSTIGK